MQHRLDSKVPFIAVRNAESGVMVQHMWRSSQLYRLALGMTGVVSLLVLIGAYVLKHMPGATQAVVFGGGIAVSLPTIFVFMHLKAQTATKCMCDLNDQQRELECRGLHRGSPLNLSVPYEAVAIIIRPIDVLSPSGALRWDGWLAQLSLGPGVQIDLCAGGDAQSCVQEVERVFGKRFPIAECAEPLECVG